MQEDASEENYDTELHKRYLKGPTVGLRRGPHYGAATVALGNLTLSPEGVRIWIGAFETS
jgi:hypothetical protein